MDEHIPHYLDPHLLSDCPQHHLQLEYKCVKDGPHEKNSISKIKEHMNNLGLSSVGQQDSRISQEVKYLS